MYMSNRKQHEPSINNDFNVIIRNIMVTCIAVPVCVKITH